MANRIRWIVGLMLAVAVLTACTRRPETPPVVELTVIPATATVNAAAPSEPQVQAAPTVAPDGEAPPAGDAVVTDDGDPNAATADGEAGANDVPLRPSQTFQYTVQEGDNVSYLAEKFGTTMQTLRELNFLTDDNIQAGNVLIVPYVEGITAEGVPTPLPAPYEYTVQQGDTLGAIELRFGVNQLSIIEANQLLTPDSLIVGTTLIIPGYVPESAAPAAADIGATAGGAGATDEFVTYIVQPSDTFFSIAQEFGVDPDDLAIANNVVNRNVLRAGQQLVIPGVTVRDELIRRGRSHTVASGETLSEIAAQYGVSMQDIMTINEITDPNAIIVGQALIIPGE